jgi:hypothetical protein
MAEFTSWRDFWTFYYSILNQNRYIHEKKVDDFLQAVLETCDDRKVQLCEGSYLYRSQLGSGLEPCYDDRENYIADIPCPHPQDRMKPLSNQASEGRANPKGIPYLYLATQSYTAISEVRPWIGSLISVGLFRTIKDLVLIDCSIALKKTKIYLTEPEQQKIKEAVWTDIDIAFSTPVTNNDNQAEYTPTQIIAELFKANGFDGIMYRSTFSNPNSGNEGKNIALFDINNADLVNCQLFEITKISLEPSLKHNGYCAK